MYMAKLPIICLPGATKMNETDTNGCSPVQFIPVASVEERVGVLKLLSIWNEPQPDEPQLYKKEHAECQVPLDSFCVRWNIITSDWIVFLHSVPNNNSSKLTDAINPFIIASNKRSHRISISKWFLCLVLAYFTFESSLSDVVAEMQEEEKQLTCVFVPNFFTMLRRTQNQVWNSNSTPSSLKSREGATLVCCRENIKEPCAGRAALWQREGASLHVSETSS